jgi:putative two-component system hydrogenase maturation factor HypX/HoxX
MELDIADSVAAEAVALFKPALWWRPFSSARFPSRSGATHLCLVVHPGIVGDRGPVGTGLGHCTRGSEWGVTVLQAEAEMDAGPVWAAETFAMRAATKSSLYRNEVTEAASRAGCRAVAFAAGRRPRR